MFCKERGLEKGFDLALSRGGDCSARVGAVKGGWEKGKWVIDKRIAVGKL